MLNKTKMAIACGLVTLMAGAAFAQGEGSAEPQPKYYHLDFQVKEMDGGKVINSRHYSATGTKAAQCSIRTGSKVPVTTGSGSVTSYIDVGVNIDCRILAEIDGNLSLSLTAEISSTANSGNPPVIRQNKWISNVIVPVGKPTIVFSSDDLTTKGQLQLEVTATPVK